MKFQNVILFLVFLIITIVEGFRYQVGTDTRMYEVIYNNSLNTQYSSTFVEIGYLYLNKSFLMMGLSFQMFLLATAVFINYNFIKGFVKLKLDSVSALFFYITTGIYFSTFNTLRQAIAISIIFSSLYLVIEKKYIKFTSLVFVSFFVHRSVFVALIIILLSRITINPLVFSFLITSLFVIINSSIIDELILWSFNYLPIKYSMYMDEILEDGGVKLFNLILPTLILIIIIIGYKRFIKINENNKFFINLYFMYYFCLIISTKFLLFYRISSYFEISLLLILPSIVQLFKIKDRVIIDVLIVVIFVTYILGKIILGHYGVLPYNVNFNL
ncbi:EpsG family protein [Peribacillus sp. NPDC097895]|uniref:EpsG family protein n=1 Tax=Peribacillus sp. NPDC097895 TaxID=3390619 RepID=UPI003D05810A